jgi:chromate transporter
MIYLELFWSFFQIGLFSIGGGYADMPLIQNQVVDLNSWLTMKEFADIVTISQMTPGPIAINAASFVGLRVAGFRGAIIATIGCITPSCIIVLTLSYLYYKYKKLELIRKVLAGLRPAIIALIASAGVSIFLLSIFDGGSPSLDLSKIDLISFSLFAVSLVILRKFRTNPIYIMITAGIIRVGIEQLI